MTPSSDIEAPTGLSVLPHSAPAGAMPGEWRHYGDRLNIPAEMSAVADWLSSPATWPVLLPGLSGNAVTGWRWRGDPCRLLVQARGGEYWLALYNRDDQPLLQLTLKPRQRHSATDVAIRVTVPPPSPLAAVVQLPGRQAGRLLSAIATAVAARFPPWATPLPDVSPGDNNALLAVLEATYPRTSAAFHGLPDGAAALGRVYDLTRRWQAGERPRSGLIEHGIVPPVAARDTFDAIVAGGVMGLLYATALACLHGRRVLVFDRYEVGCTHREWNISAGEFSVLADVGLFTKAELASVVTRHYERGRVAFHAGGIAVPAVELMLDDILDVAIDADAFLALCLRRFVAAGGVVRSGLAFQRAVVSDRGPTRVLVEADSVDGPCQFAARLLIDAMGSGSPIAAALTNGHAFGGVCPTVGTVATGFETGRKPETVDPRVGDVLVSVADSLGGRQHIWEAFPGRQDAVTVYLFYYDRARRDANLLALFEDYFTLLPTYKRMGQDFKHLKTVYGYIPARHRDRLRQPAVETAHQGILSLGDAAAQQSPLTFCGFGSAVRSVARVAPLLEWCLRHDLLEAQHLRLATAAQPNLAVLWVFSRFMQPRRAPIGRPADVNEIMNVFCAALRDLGPSLTERFFKDCFTWTDYTRLVLLTARRHPAVFPLTLSMLGLKGAALWGVSYLEFTTASVRATVLDGVLAVAGQPARRAAARRWPALGLRILAHQRARQAHQGWPDRERLSRQVTIS